MNPTSAAMTPEGTKPKRRITMEENIPCDENCENRILAQWDGHFVQQCKRHPSVIRRWCGEAHIETTVVLPVEKIEEVIPP